MTPPTLPKSLVLRLCHAALNDRIRRLDTVAHHSPRATKDLSKHEARERTLYHLNTERKKVEGLMADHPKGVVRADVAGLLIAWVAGHGEAVGDMERLLEETTHPAFQRTTEIKADDIGEACAVLMGEPK